jgi:hypothetical protein
MKNNQNNLTQRRNIAMKKKSGLTRILLVVAIATALTLGICSFAAAHCDTMDGPLVADAKLAFEKNNVNYVLKWISQDKENEIIKAFKLVMKVRPLNADAKELAENYFFDILVRIHRTGEGESFTGVKPHGTPIDEAIKAADKSIELGNLSPLEKIVPKAKMPKLKALFKKVMSLKKYDVNEVKKGREYIEAYVEFFKFAEGEDETHK